MASTTQPGSSITVEAWGLLPEDAEGELVNGQLIEEEMATLVHEALVAFLITVFTNWLGQNRGLVGGSNTKFKVSSRGGRKPDVFVYLPGTVLPRADARVIETPPDIMVEVVSAARNDQRRDRIEKLAEYEHFGVAYYWIVDPQLRSLEILEQGPDGRYIHAVTAGDGRLDRVPGCEGLVLDIDALWAIVDRLLPSEPVN